MSLTRIAVVQIAHDKREHNYAVYGLDERGVCRDQEFFSYERDTRAAAFAKALRRARAWAEESKACIEEKWQ